MLLNLILVIAVGAFAFSGFQLYKIVAEYEQGAKEYQEIQQLVTNEKKSGEKSEEEFSVDFAALREMNEDIIGWIRFEEPAEINYPVVKGRDNEEYLTRTFWANDNKLGTLFIDVNNSPAFTDRNTIIYGHNMKNGTMFAQLLKYKDEEFFNAHPYFYVYTPDGKELKYQVAVAGIVKDVAENYRQQFDTDEEFAQYLEMIKGTSMYPTNVDANMMSQILTLSTCTNQVEDDRFIVQAVKISEVWQRVN